MGLFTDHSFTAVTATINQIVISHDDEYAPETDLPDLLDAIRKQAQQGGTEAARAIRKNLKHGSVKEQIRSLFLYELLVANGGDGKAMRTFYNDHRLIVCMGQCAGDTQRPGKIRRKISALAKAWRVYEGVPGYEGVALIYKTVPLVTKLRKYSNVKVTNRGKTVPDFMRDLPDETYNVFNDEGNVITGPIAVRPLGEPGVAGSTHPVASSRELDRQFRIPAIDYVKERPKIQALLAQCTQHSTALSNLLTLLPPGTLAIDDRKCYSEFDICRQLRRKLLRYLQLVSSEEFLGSLLVANDAMIATLLRFSAACTTDEAQEDSYYETESEGESEGESRRLDSQGGGLQASNNGGPAPGFSDLKLGLVLRHKRPPPPPPQRPQPLVAEVDESDSEDPFGDRHVMN